jgi:hypothetical protein
MSLGNVDVHSTRSYGGGSRDTPVALDSVHGMAGHGTALIRSYPFKEDHAMTTPSETTLRRRADRLGLRLSRGGRKIVGVPRGWQLINPDGGWLVFGGDWGVDLDDIATELEGGAAEQR